MFCAPEKLLRTVETLQPAKQQKMPATSKETRNIRRNTIQLPNRDRSFLKMANRRINKAVSPKN